MKRGASHAFITQPYDAESWCLNALSAVRRSTTNVNAARATLHVTPYRGHSAIARNATDENAPANRAFSLLQWRHVSAAIALGHDSARSKRVLRFTQARSKRSSCITLVHAATKSCTNFSCASALA